MNQKNNFGLNKCFKDLKNPIELFTEWFIEAKKTEINDPNAVAVATVNENKVPSVRMVLLKDYNKNGFVFYTNLNSEKSSNIKSNPNVAMCFHWKSLLRQVRITGKINSVKDSDADEYYNSRAYGSRIGAWASNQSSVLKNRNQLYSEIENFKKKFPENEKVPRPPYWSGWSLSPSKMEFWLDGDNRIHERLLYIKNESEEWERKILSP